MSSTSGSSSGRCWSLCTPLSSWYPLYNNLWAGCLILTPLSLKEPLLSCLVLVVAVVVDAGPCAPLSALGRCSLAWHGLVAKVEICLLFSHVWTSLFTVILEWQIHVNDKDKEESGIRRWPQPTDMFEHLLYQTLLVIPLIIALLHSHWLIQSSVVAGRYICTYSYFPTASKS